MTLGFYKTKAFLRKLSKQIKYFKARMKKNLFKLKTE